MNAPYLPRRTAQSRSVTVRGFENHLFEWGDISLVTPDRPTLVMAHGWMDVAASFQFVVDALAALEGPTRHIVAIDWRGCGLTQSPPADSYWFLDYLGDLDAVIHALAASDRPIDLLGHSMGANAVMLYAGVRPTRVRRLVNLEGFGLPTAPSGEAPARYARWLDQLKTPMPLHGYDSLGGVVRRLQRNNPRLSADKAEWLAPHWARRQADGRWHILADEGHKRISPLIYHKEDAMACWAQISAPVLLVEGQETGLFKGWDTRYPREEFQRRIQTVAQLEQHSVPQAGHMLHHDQPEQVAHIVQRFLSS